MEKYRLITYRLLTIVLLVFGSVGMAHAGDVLTEAQLVDSIGKEVKKHKNNTTWWKRKDVVTTITNAIKEYPDNPKLNYYYGLYLYKAKGDMASIKSARYHFVRALQTDVQLYGAKQMMIAVEDTLGNYSSAICYVNEVLEAQPYDKGLWERKIALYRKLGNLAEAEATKERMAHIFANDTDVRKQYANRWNLVLKRSELDILASDMEMKIDELKGNAAYSDYETLVEYYTSLGQYDKAIATGLKCLKRARGITPKEKSKMTKTVSGLMMSMNRYSQAQDFLADTAAHADKAYLSQLLQLMADDARLHDPYEANQRLYGKTRSRDALNYLVKTSISRGYYEDAKTYLEAFYGKDSTELLKQQYALELRMGHDQAAQNTLLKLYRRDPRNEKLRSEYIDAFQRLANSDVANGQWRDAEKSLRALGILLNDSVGHTYWPSMMVRRMTTYGHLQRYDAVRAVYQEAVGKVPQDSMLFASAYEEMALNRMRAFEEEERYDSALYVAQQLCDDLPASAVALRHCINMSQTLRRDSLFYKYAERGYKQNGQEPYYILKQTAALGQQRRYREALQILGEQCRKSQYVSPAIVSAHSGITLQMLADSTMRHVNHDKDSLMRYVVRALNYDPDNKELLYYLGLAFERSHKWDSAHYYQSKYQQPAVAEQRQYYQHMDYLENKSFSNRIDVNYTHALYDTRQDNLASTGHLYSIATVAYTHSDSLDAFTGQVSYKGIDGYHDASDHESGGAGIELMGQWERQFTKRWSGMISASWANRYFNKWGINVAASYAADNGWTPSLKVSYRRTPKTYLFLSGNSISDTENKELNLFIASPSVMKEWGDRIRTTLNVDMAVINSGVYYNVGLKGKLFFNDDNISSVSLITGLGSFPELSFFEQTALRNVSHTNTMVGLDALVLCTSHLSVGLSGNWNTCYDPHRNADGTLSDSYRNIYSITTHLHVAF